MNNLWIFLSMFVLFFTAGKTIMLKVFDNSKYDSYICLASSFLLIGVFSLIYLVINKNNVKKIVYSNNCNDFLKLVSIFTILSIGALIFGPWAINLSPNITYNHLIINLNIILTLIASYFLFRQKLNWWTFTGILITLIGVSIVIYYS
jgi:drug/metabolite transporter (DMT)-like permease